MFNCFKGVQCLEISGVVVGKKVTLRYHSISEDEFRDALNRNKEQVSLFTSKYKVNEKIDEYANRYDNLLILGSKVHLTDREDDGWAYGQSFFLNNKFDNCYILQKRHFESEETFFLDSHTFDTILYLYGHSVSTRKKDGLVLYSRTLNAYKEHPSPLMMFKISPNNEVDTLLYSREKMVTYFSFFDKNKPYIYYVHTFFDEEEWKEKSVFAKMEFTYKKPD